MAEKIHVFMASDHAGYALKQGLAKHLEKQGCGVVDIGPSAEHPVDYPDYAYALCKALSLHEDTEMSLGVLICGTGQGMAMTANRYVQGKHIRAAVCWSEEVAVLARGHNDANVLCLPARFLDEKEAIGIVDAFFGTPFEAGRHARRLGLMHADLGKRGVRLRLSKKKSKVYPLDGARP